MRTSLLARIYVRTLGDMSAGDVQKENLAKAIEQFQAILKIQPDDTYSALWLARASIVSKNKHMMKPRRFLRALVKRDPDSGPALEQLSQLLIDEGRSQDAVDLLTQAAGDSASPEIYDSLGDAYSQSKNYAKSEDAYRRAVDEDPDDPGHLHGLAQALMAQNKYSEALEQYKRLTEIEPSTRKIPCAWRSFTVSLANSTMPEIDEACCARSSSLLAAWKFSTTKRCSMRSRADSTTR